MLQRSTCSNNVRLKGDKEEEGVDTAYDPFPFLLRCAALCKYNNPLITVSLPFKVFYSQGAVASTTRRDSSVLHPHPPPRPYAVAPASCCCCCCSDALVVASSELGAAGAFPALWPASASPSSR